MGLGHGDTCRAEEHAWGWGGCMVCMTSRGQEVTLNVAPQLTPSIPR